jgi:hypothetical protein
LDDLRTRFIVLTFQYKNADSVSAETIKTAMRNVLRAIAHLEAELRIEQLCQRNISPTHPASDSEASFERTIERDFTSIRSVCKNCGAVIVASVRDGLAELEAIHWSACKERSQSSDLVKFRRAS